MQTGHVRIRCQTSLQFSQWSVCRQAISSPFSRIFCSFDSKLLSEKLAKIFQKLDTLCRTVAAAPQEWSPGRLGAPPAQFHQSGSQIEVQLAFAFAPDFPFLCVLSAARSDPDFTLARQAQQRRLG